MQPFRASGIFRKYLGKALGLTERCEAVRRHLRIGKITELARPTGSRLSVGQDCFKAALRQLPPSLGTQIKY
jgi:hypothetical protein